MTLGATSTPSWNGAPGERGAGDEHISAVACDSETGLWRILAAGMDALLEGARSETEFLRRLAPWGGWVGGGGGIHFNEGAFGDGGSCGTRGRGLVHFSRDAFEGGSLAKRGTVSENVS